VSAASIFWGFLFGSFGLGFFIYGKKQHIANTILLVVMGVALIAIPCFVRI